MMEDRVYKANLDLGENQGRSYCIFYGYENLFFIFLQTTRVSISFFFNENYYLNFTIDLLDHLVKLVKKDLKVI